MSSDISNQNQQLQAKKNARARYLLLLAAILVLILTGDQTSKQLIVNSMQPGQSIPIWGETLRFTYVQNEGGAFSSSIGSNTRYIIFSIVIIALVIAVFFRKFGEHQTIDIAMATVLGGAFGNLIDRFRFEAVVDFIDMNIPDIDMLGIQMTRWPVYNIADIAITVGIIVIILSVLFTKPKTNPP